MNEPTEERPTLDAEYWRAAWREERAKNDRLRSENTEMREASKAFFTGHKHIVGTPEWHRTMAASIEYWAAFNEGPG